MLRQRKGSGRHPVTRRPAPDRGPQGSERDGAALPRHFDDSLGSEEQLQGRAGVVLPFADGAIEHSPCSIFNRLRYGDRDPEQTAVGTRKADVRKRHECHVGGRCRRSLRQVAAQLFRNRIRRVVENGCTHRRCQFHRPGRRYCPGAVSELEHDPVAGGIGLVPRALVWCLFDAAVPDIGMGQRARSETLMARELALELAELSPPHGAHALATVTEFMGGLGRLLDQAAGNEGGGVAQSDDTLEQPIQDARRVLRQGSAPGEHDAIIVGSDGRIEPFLLVALLRQHLDRRGCVRVARLSDLWFHLSRLGQLAFELRHLPGHLAAGRQELGMEPVGQLVDAVGPSFMPAPGNDGCVVDGHEVGDHRTRRRARCRDRRRPLRFQPLQSFPFRLVLFVLCP